MKILGIPVKIELSFLIVAFALAYPRLNLPLLMLEWVGVLFLAVLVHEFGHALVAKKFGATPSITFKFFGGLTAYQIGTITLPQRILISLAGPIAGFVLGGISYALKLILPELALPDPQLRFYSGIILQDLVWINIGLSIFNLLPIIPLDGGNVIAGLENWLSPKTEEMIARVISLLSCIILAILAFKEGYYFTLIILYVFFSLNLGKFIRPSANPQESHIQKLFD